MARPCGGRQLQLHWVLHLLCLLLMVETMSGASGPSTGAHTTPEFPASGVNQSPVVDVSIQAGSCYQVGLYSSNQQIFIEHLYVPGTESIPRIYQGTIKTKIPVLMELTVSWEDRKKSKQVKFRW